VLYTAPGIPFLYYGDEIAMPGGNDPDNRRDMVWTGDLSSVGMGGTSLTSQQAALQEDIAALGRARRDHVALRRGRRVPLYVTDDVYVIAWVHADDLVVVAVNRGGAVSGLPVALTSTMLAGRTAVDVAAGEGTASVVGTDLRVDLEAGAAAVFALRSP
jgi:glycosidase